MGIWAKLKQVKDSVTAKTTSAAVDSSEAPSDGQTTVPEPSEIYASELVDEKTCQKCAEIDGHDYDSLAEARADYSMDGYKHCESESGCRGTLVMMYEDSV
jgi:hypothetical protein